MISQILAKQTINEICIIRLSALGDVCHFLPTYHAIKNKFPNANITWVIGKLEHQLVGDLPDTRFVVIDKSAGLAAYWQYRQQMKSSQFDLLIHAQTSLRANMFAWLTPAKYKIGFDKQRSRELHYHVCNLHLAPAPDQHQVDDFLDFALALQANVADIKWGIPIPPEATEFASLHIQANQPVLAINACSSPSKRVFRNWDSKRYVEVCQYAYQVYKAQVVICGGPSKLEQEIATSIVEAVRIPVVNLVGQTNLKQLCAVLKAADVLLTSDSGPAHIATAVGTKVIALHAATNPLQIGPYQQQDLWVSHYQDAVQEEYQKPIDTLPFGIRAHGEHVMDKVTVDEVKKKIDNVFGTENQSSKL